MTASLGSRVRATALLALGALAVHQLRYALATGELTGFADAHGYLGLLAPLAIVGAIAAVAVSLLAAAAGRLAPRRRASLDATERAALYALALLAVYFGQELAESALVARHGGASAALTGAGGWLVLPLAIGLGALAALAGGWLDRVELALAGLEPAPPRRPPRRIGGARPVARVALASLALAFGLARRPPPALPSFA